MKGGVKLSSTIFLFGVLDQVRSDRYTNLKKIVEAKSSVFVDCRQHAHRIHSKITRGSHMTWPHVSRASMLLTSPLAQADSLGESLLRYSSELTFVKQHPCEYAHRRYPNGPPDFAETANRLPSTPSRAGHSLRPYKRSLATRRSTHLQARDDELYTTLASNICSRLVLIETPCHRPRSLTRVNHLATERYALPREDMHLICVIIGTLRWPFESRIRLISCRKRQVSVAESRADQIRP